MVAGHTEDVVIVRGTAGMPQSAVMWPLADHEASQPLDFLSTQRRPPLTAEQIPRMHTLTSR